MAKKTFETPKDLSGLSQEELIEIIKHQSKVMQGYMGHNKSLHERLKVAETSVESAEKTMKELCERLDKAIGENESNHKALFKASVMIHNRNLWLEDIIAALQKDRLIIRYLEKHVLPFFRKRAIKKWGTSNVDRAYTNLCINAFHDEMEEIMQASEENDD